LCGVRPKSELAREGSATRAAHAGLAGLSATPKENFIELMGKDASCGRIVSQSEAIGVTTQLDNGLKW